MYSFDYQDIDILVKILIKITVISRISNIKM
jgi:hypothetical protein